MEEEEAKGLEEADRTPRRFGLCSLDSGQPSRISQERRGKLRAGL